MTSSLDLSKLTYSAEYHRDKVKYKLVDITEINQEITLIFKPIDIKVAEEIIKET